MKTIETTIDIHAPASAVWATLVDFDAYPEWNSFVTRISGTPTEGERLEVRLDPPGSREMTFKPRVTAATPNEHLEWLGRLFVPGLLDGRHEFRLEALGENRTRLHHGESFSGLLVGLVLDVGGTRRGFEAMNEALKIRAETTGNDPYVGEHATA
jgi:hypothetical protein